MILKITELARLHYSMNMNIYNIVIPIKDKTFEALSISKLHDINPTFFKI